jgi:Protein of unknown function (DUF2510)
MAFNILTIRTAEHEDGSLYPVLGDDKSEIEIEQLDGKDIKILYANALQVRRVVGSSLVKEVGIADIKATVYITDARVAVACSKYDKGGGWRGASLAVPVLNLASKARAASRRKGKMLVGQIRYPWLAQVGFTEKAGFGTLDALRLEVVEKADGVERVVYLDLDFPKGTDTGRLALLISQRSAAYRLRNDPELSPDEREKFEHLVRGVALRSEPKKFAFFKMPTRYFVSSASAYPKKAIATNVPATSLPTKPAAAATAAIIDLPAMPVAAPAIDLLAKRVAVALPAIVVPPTPEFASPIVPQTVPVPAQAPATSPPDGPFPFASLEAVPMISSQAYAASTSTAPPTSPSLLPPPVVLAEPVLAQPEMPVTVYVGHPGTPLPVEPPSIVRETIPARWSDDPYGLHQHRYWDGQRWTAHVSDNGVASFDQLSPMSSSNGL